MTGQPTNGRRASRAAHALLLGGMLAGSACTPDLTGLNVNPNSPDDVPPGPLFTNAAQTLVARFRGANFDLTMTSLFAQHFAKVQYVDEDQYNLRTSTIALHFATPYTGGLKDLQTVIDKGDSASRPNVAGPARVLKSWTFQIMTDTWGDIPYTGALRGDSVGAGFRPAYTAQKDIYYGMLAELTTAATTMTGPSAADQGLGNSDPIYAGNTTRWRRFANALRARMALRIADVDPAKANAELEAAFKAPGGLMTSNADNAQLAWPGDGVFDNPWAVNFATRDDHRLSKTLVDTLNALVDPRVAVYGQPTRANASVYAGLRNALSTSAAAAFFNTTSRPGAIFYPGATTYGTFGTSAGKRTPSFLMVFAEQAFIQAEAAARGLGGLGAGQARAFYEAGVRASFEQWGLTLAQADAYLQRPGVAYQAGAEGLRQIGLQKWIALFAQGSEAWAEYRRTGSPASLTVGPAAILGSIPARVPYSVDEQSVNSAALAEAIARQGADAFTTRVWWDRQ